MERNRLVVNTLVFLDSLQNGTPQAELVARLHDTFGVPAVEVRREFVHSPAEELPAIRKAAAERGVRLYYSVPDTLYENGMLRTQLLEALYGEAQAMGCAHVKLTLGDAGPQVREQDMLALRTLCTRYGIHQTIENDQTPENGRLDKIVSFLRQAGGAVTATFDVGNWLWQGEDPFAAAAALAPYTTYIHLKNPRAGAQGLVTAALEETALDWRAVLRALPKAPVALEYPCEATLDRELSVLLAADV